MKRVQAIPWQLLQRINIQFCVKLGWSFDEIKHGLQTCYGVNNNILSDRSIHRWVTRFRTGHANVVDMARAPKPKTGRSQRNIRKVEDVVAADRRITIREIALKTGLSRTTVQRILRKDLKLSKRCATFVPAVLTDAHKQRRQDVCNFFTRLMGQNPRVFQNVVTMDESWIYTWDLAMRVHNKEWLRPGEPKPIVPRRRTLATAKAMIVSFFDSKGMIYYEYVTCPQTVNQQVFHAIFRRFDAAHTRRRPHSTVHGQKFLHLDNALAHKATLTLALIDQLGWSRLPQPSYSPDLAPSDFWLNNRLKRNLKGVRFANLDALKEAVSDKIALIPALEYRHSLMVSWPKRWHCCLQEQGNFFEGTT